MRCLGLLLIAVFPGILCAQNKVSEPCLNAIHEHYLYTLLIEPNIKTIPKNKQNTAIQKGESLIAHINRECETNLASGLLKKTDEFQISTSDYLKYFQQDLGMDMPLVGHTIPLNRANMSDQEIKFWSSLVLLKSYEITVEKFKSFSHLKPYYNLISLQKLADDIYGGYLKGRSTISKNNQITITDKALEVHANIVSLPTITFQGIDKNERYVWRLKVPMLIQTKMGDRVKKEQITVSIHVTRVEQSLAVDGVIISQFSIDFE